MTGRGLLVALLVLLSTLACVDFAFGRYARARFLPETQRRTALAQGTHCVVTLGDSRTLVGIDPQVFPAELARRGVDSCFAQLAIGGGTVEAQYVALRRYVEDEARAPRLVVWGISSDAAVPRVRSPDQFTGNNAVVLAWSRASDVMLHYPDFPRRNFDDGFRFLAARSTDLSSYASLLWNAVQRGQDQFARWGKPAARNRFGLLSDMAALERSMASDLTDALADGARAALGVASQVTATIELCEKHDIPMLLVELPMPERHRRRVDSQPTTLRIRQELSRLAKTRRGSFESFDDPSWLDPVLFSDPVHLGSLGARRFSTELAERVARQVLATKSAK